MSSKSIIGLLLIIIMIFNIQIGIAAKDSDYDIGYKVGFEIGEDNVDVVNPISATRELRNYKASYKYKRFYGDEDEFEDGFLDGYEDGYEGETKIGTNYADELGTLLGDIYGSSDFQDGRESDWKDSIPSDENLITMYNLDKESKRYINSFLDVFKLKFEEAYIASFEKANFEPIKTTLLAGIKDGEEIGVLMGRTSGAKDHFEGRYMNFKRYLLSDRDIISQYSIKNDYKEYMEGFLSGFKRAYELEYNRAYRAANQHNTLNKTVSEIIPISGGLLTTADGIFTVTVVKGTFYNPVNLTIDTFVDYSSYIGNNYIKGSEAVRVNISNTSGYLDNEKSIELKFEYYGDANKSGIYKFVNNNWIYINSEVEDGYIKTLIKPNSINDANGIYAVLLNKETPIFHDIRGHWAKDEINTLIRRSIINGYSDNTFKPENKITRAEFLTLLSRIYNWNLPSNASNTTQFKDYARFGNYEEIISYGISAGYIKGYDDNTFRPHDTISFKEVEIIMGRAVDKNFKWYNTSVKMLYDKKVRASSYDNINNKINRGEVSYMLYILNEGKY